MSAGQNEERELDYALWLSSPVFVKIPKEIMDGFYTNAVAYGRELAVKYPIGTKTPAEFADSLGVKKIKILHQADGQSGMVKAYYVPEEKTIYWDDTFAEKLMELSGAEEAVGSRSDVERAILLHELFHHLEETAEQPTDSMIYERYSRRCPPIFREIGAFAFVNEQMPGYCCQRIDAFWLKRV